MPEEILERMYTYTSYVNKKEKLKEKLMKLVRIKGQKLENIMSIAIALIKSIYPEDEINHQVYREKAIIHCLMAFTDDSIAMQIGASYVSCTKTGVEFNYSNNYDYCVKLEKEAAYNRPTHDLAFSRNLKHIIDENIKDKVLGTIQNFHMGLGNIQEDMDYMRNYNVRSLTQFEK